MANSNGNKLNRYQRLFSLTAASRPLGILYWSFLNWNLKTCTTHPPKIKLMRRVGFIRLGLIWVVVFLTGSKRNRGLEFSNVSVCVDHSNLQTAHKAECLARMTIIIKSNYPVDLDNNASLLWALLMDRVLKVSYISLRSRSILPIPIRSTYAG